ncbi:HEAT repeat domain-containing protein [Methanoregula sp.]|uniref:HEAT repeat domain-containing protein n=1 Tax=Methanoregula sp. TaxID=2052170 RepID=UPI002368F614|nr:HEAT repeat domain-containing protein [Methanoregula sp.]MDD1687458.1 HEAT repeat domain-containing protein [Methanoregula sp.]
MNTSVENENGEWFNALPRSGGVYDLVSAAQTKADTGERLRAVTALGKSDDPRAVRPLMDLLDDADPEVRLSATTALGLLKSGRPVDSLIGRLRDAGERRVTREQAAVALSAIRSTGALRGLREFVADEYEDASLRSFAGGLLRSTGSL